MRVVQTVFGVFHHFELARELARRGHLQRVYSTWPWARLEREKLPRSLVRTFPWVHAPEMMLRRWRFEPAWFLDHSGYANSITFDWFVQRQLRSEPRPDALIAISGSSLKAGRDLQRRGGIFICDRGSSHQRFQEQLIFEEYRRWGVTRLVTSERDIRREEQIYETADAITVPSSFSARTFLARGIAEKKVHVIPYGVRLDRFTRSGEPAAGRFDVLFAGSVGLRKGIPYLLKAFAALQHTGKRLRIAGSMHPDLAGVLATLPQEKVEFLGSVSQERLVELMSTSHVMVLPSIEEGLALVQGQALACGCPVLATTNTGAEDLFTDEVEGFIVPIRSVEALLGRMQRLAEDTALQQRMSEAAMRRVASLGGWEDYGDRWETLLYQLTGQQPPPTK